MLNTHLNIPALRAVYARHGALSIQNALRPELAENIHNALLELDWQIELKDYSSNPSFRIQLRNFVGACNLTRVIDELEHELNRDKLFFLRLCAEREQFIDPVLTQFSDYLNSESFLSVMRAITGIDAITHSWVEATCYDKGCFLGGHRDDHHPNNAVAFVFNFTRHWQLDWGGLLMLLLTENQHPTIIPPLWNSLSMFTVPVDHLVSCVSPAATGKRYSMTGWLRR